MTLETSTNGSVPAQWNDDTGLEDFDMSDASMPRLVIEHVDAVFKDSQTEETFESLIVIPLGLHKGRLMWPSEINEGDKDAPMCKSPDFIHGFPNLDISIAEDKRFPWGASNFDMGTESELQLPDGRKTLPALPCAECRFKEWNSDPSGKRPWCSEEWTIPLLYLSGEYEEEYPSENDWNPALFTVRRSGLKSAKKYITSFKTRKIPLFVNECKLSLDISRRGAVKYCTPVFTKSAETLRDNWQGYRDTFVVAKTYLSELPKQLAPENIEDNTWEPSKSENIPEPRQGKRNVVEAGPIEDPWKNASPLDKDRWPDPVQQSQQQQQQQQQQQPQAESARVGVAEFDPEEEPPF